MYCRSSVFWLRSWEEHPHLAQRQESWPERSRSRSFIWMGQLLSWLGLPCSFVSITFYLLTYWHLACMQLTCTAPSAWPLLSWPFPQAGSLALMWPGGAWAQPVRRSCCRQCHLLHMDVARHTSFYLHQVQVLELLMLKGALALSNSHLIRIAASCRRSQTGNFG